MFGVTPFNKVYFHKPTSFGKKGLSIENAMLAVKYIIATAANVSFFLLEERSDGLPACSAEVESLVGMMELSQPLAGFSVMSSANPLITGKNQYFTPSNPKYSMLLLQTQILSHNISGGSRQPHKVEVTPSSANSKHGKPKH